MEIAKDSRHTK